MTSHSQPVRLFFSYAHEDEALRDNLTKHLGLLKRQNYIASWYDQLIIPGQEWEKETDRKLEEADVILLLVSNDFITSDFCWGVELERAMNRHHSGTAHVVPIILRPCEWNHTPFAKLQVLPPRGRAVTEWDNKDKAWLEITTGIRRVVMQLHDKPVAKSVTPAGLQSNRVVWEITLNVASAEFDGDTLEKILTFLRHISGDSELTIRRTRKGSVILELNLSLEARARLKTLIASGVLTHILGFEIQGAKSLSAKKPEILRKRTLEKPVVFISHRHADKAIAHVVNRHLAEWGIAERNIFQSSDPKQGSTAGQNQAQYLKSKLANTNLFILIYTHSDEDWAFCMWEAGIVQGRSDVNTRFVVFQGTEDAPKTFIMGKKLVSLFGLEEITRFTKDFHKTPGFIPPKDRNASPVALRPDTPESVIVERAKRFYQDLMPVLPADQHDTHLWDFIRLHLEPEPVEAIRRLGDEKKVRQVLENYLLLKRPHFVGLGYNVNTAIRQFGFAGFEEGIKLSDLIEQWRRQDTTQETAWIDGLYTTIYRAIVNKPTPAVAHPFKSVREGVDWWFHASVTRIRVNRDHSREFDVYLIRLPSNVQYSTKSKANE